MAVMADETSDISNQPQFVIVHGHEVKKCMTKIWGIFQS
jgi:hypothetical protein